jgi:hypothetical protein
MASDQPLVTHASLKVALGRDICNDLVKVFRISTSPSDAEKLAVMLPQLYHGSTERMRCIRTLIHDMVEELQITGYARRRFSATVAMFDVLLKQLAVNPEGLQFGAACVLQAATRPTSHNAVYRVVEDNLPAESPAMLMPEYVYSYLASNIDRVCAHLMPLLIRAASGVHDLALLSFRALMAQMCDADSLMFNVLKETNDFKDVIPRRYLIGDERLIDSPVLALASSSQAVKVFADKWDAKIKLHRLSVARMTTAVFDGATVLPEAMMRDRSKALTQVGGKITIPRIKQPAQHIHLYLARHLASFIYSRDPAVHSYEVMGGRQQIGKTAAVALRETRSKDAPVDPGTPKEYLKSDSEDESESEYTLSPNYGEQN